MAITTDRKKKLKPVRPLPDITEEEKYMLQHSPKSVVTAFLRRQREGIDAQDLVGMAVGQGKDVTIVVKDKDGSEKVTEITNGKVVSKPPTDDKKPEVGEISKADKKKDEVKELKAELDEAVAELEQAEFDANSAEDEEKLKELKKRIVSLKIKISKRK